MARDVLAHDPAPVPPGGPNAHADGTRRTFAQRLGENQAASMLQETLDEEREADVELTRLATQEINLEAEHTA